MARGAILPRNPPPAQVRLLSDLPDRRRFLFVLTLAPLAGLRPVSEILLNTLWENDPERVLRVPGRDRRLYGARDGLRTRDPQLGKLMLYQLSYSRLE